MTHPTSTPVPMLLLDLDGTVRHGKDQLGRFVNGPADVVVFPEAIARMRAWRSAGGRVIGISNQGGIALGLVAAGAVDAAMRETQLHAGGLFDRIAYCRHHPDAPDPLMAHCWCRKPKPGLAIEAMGQLARQLEQRDVHEMYPPHMALMVGDRAEDQACAGHLGVEFRWAEAWRAGR